MAHSFCAVLTAAALLGASLASLPEVAQADAAAEVICRPGSKVMMRTELVFGTQRSQMPPVSRAAWRRFIAREVSPRFPDGFTVIDAEGGWHSQRGLIRETAHILIVWHDATPRQNDQFEALRTIYKQRFHQQSVLRIDGSDCMSF